MKSRCVVAGIGSSFIADMAFPAANPARGGLIRRCLRWVFVVALLATIGATGTCRVIAYVDTANGSGIEDGTVDHPYSTIQKAIDRTSGPTSIVVAPGTYAGFALADRPGMQLKKWRDPVPVIDGMSATSTVITLSGTTQLDLVDVKILLAAKDGIRVGGGSSVTLLRTTVESPVPSNTRAIVGDAGSSIAVSRSTVRGGSGAYVTGPASYVGVSDGSLFESTGTGIRVFGGTQLVIADSRFALAAPAPEGSFGTIGVVAGSVGTQVTIESSSFAGATFFSVIIAAGATAEISRTIIRDTEGVALAAQDAGTAVIATDVDLVGNEIGANATYGGTLELVRCHVTDGVVGATTYPMNSSLVIRDGTVIENNVRGVQEQFLTSITVDGASVRANDIGIAPDPLNSSGLNFTLIVRNGASISENTGDGILTTSGSHVVVTNSTIADNGGNGITCNGATCDVGAGAGLGNTISGHVTSGKFGIACPSTGVANCAPGENVFSGNATDIDPACAATCVP